MPWKETCVLEERMKFVLACQLGEENMAELCVRFGISRRTGYKWRDRYADESMDGLPDRSRAPYAHPNATPEPVETMIVAFRRAHPRWGGRKIRQRLWEQQPQIPWPAASTIGEVLTRHGLVTPRQIRRRTPPYTKPFASCTSPNDVWSADFKGWFPTGDGRRCDPFTLSDANSRFLLRCQVVPRPNREWVQQICDDAFREYGLPRAIRTDNGPPFAAPSLGGLTRLAVHWIKLGILPERIAPGKPQQNGRHERMHRTLKEHTATPPQPNARRQQEAFDRFRTEYNHERPHEALGQRTPASVYHPSTRPYPRRPPEIVYPDAFVVRRVRRRGDIKWRGTKLYLSERLIGEPVGLQQVDDDHWRVYFGPVLLATWSPRTKKLYWPKRRR